MLNQRFLELKALCGNTPLIKLSEKLYCKLETTNPTGSVKDRLMSFVIGRALERGDITARTILCEATSGNSGISLSAIAASLGLRCVIFMPSNMSEERKKMMSLYGAEIITSPPSDFEAAIQMREDYLSTMPNSWSPRQFSNLENIECHRSVTAPEIHTQLNELGLSWGAFIHGSGTGGTIEGVRQYIRSVQGISVKTCMVIPAEDKHGIQGIGDGRNFLADPRDMTSVIEITTHEAEERAKKLARDSGLLVGISSGANIVASERWIAQNSCEGVVVTMLCDRGERYMSVYGT